jgi:hypothetical protein
MYEEEDFNAPAVVASGAGIAALVALAIVAVVGFFAIFESLSAPGPNAHPLAKPEQLPPFPRLQARPENDLSAMRAREDSILYTYGWVDRQKGIVRIPIGRAMDLLAARGLPARPPSPGLNPWAATGSQGFVGVQGTPIPGVRTATGEAQEEKRK